jgi:hypothetical protein
LGVTRLAWRDGPVEDWRILGRLLPSELMRANAAVTRLVRRLLAQQLPGRWWIWTTDRGVGEEAARWLFTLADEIGRTQRRLPDGRTVAEIAGEEGQVLEYRRYVWRCWNRWQRLANRFGARPSWATAGFTANCSSWASRSPHLGAVPPVPS